MDILPDDEDVIDAEAKHWVTRVCDPNLTRAELAAFQVWQLDGAHAQAFSRALAPVEAVLERALVPEYIDTETTLSIDYYSDAGPTNNLERWYLMETKSIDARLSLTTVGVPVKITAEQFVAPCTVAGSARDESACSDRAVGHLVRDHLDALGAIADTYGRLYAFDCMGSDVALASKAAQIGLVSSKDRSVAGTGTRLRFPLTDSEE
jgi:hypothetical protein